MFKKYVLWGFLCIQNLWGSPVSELERLMQDDRSALLRADKVNQTTRLNLESCKMSRLSGGISGARLYKLDKPNGETFVARFVPRTNTMFPDELQNEIIASSSEVTPRVHFTYLTATAAIVVRNFVGDDRQANRETDDFYGMLGRSIRQLHDRAHFERTTFYPDYLDKFYKRCADTQIHIPFQCDAKKDTLRQAYDTLRDVWRHFAQDQRAVHHDISPLNVCYFDGRLALIDWEMAAQDALWVDLAVAANFHCWTDESTDRLLRAYFNTDPTPLERAKFVFFRPYAHIFHAMNLGFISGYKDAFELEDLQNIPHHPDFQKNIREGRVDLSQKREQMRLAISTISRAIELLESDDYKNALTLIKSQGE